MAASDMLRSSWNWLSRLICGRGWRTGWLDRLEAERDNLRAALAWFTESGAIEQCLRLVGAHVGSGFIAAHLPTARTDRGALALPGAERPSYARARALAAAIVLAIWTNDAARSIPLSSEALAIHQALGDRAPQPWLLLMLGIASRNLGDNYQSWRHWQHGLALARELATS